MSVVNIATKELYTAVKSKRFVILISIYVLFLLLLAYSIKDDVTRFTEPSVGYNNLGLFGAGGNMYMTPLSFMLSVNFTFFTILGAIMGAALGADAINRELETGTVRVLLGHPVYRDEVINGKFLGNAILLSVVVFSGYVFTVAFLMILGIPLDGESVFRGFLAFLVTLIYTLVFLSFSLLLSTVFRKSESSMLVAIGTAVFMTMIYGLLVSLIAEHLAGEMPPYGTPAFEAWKEGVKLWEGRLHFINPAHHYASLMMAVFSGDPAANYYTPMGEAFALAINNLAMLMVFLLLPFAVAYVRFMTQDLR
ncbi:ABC transporter permease [Thermococcus indicus]|uniref:ABC transporter permease n=1 Tax=Thermococcus indicus TaxID=2586643 RepID=A0A4Y5SN56_9EURY|nr:ABC transporter permease [Thermococcus indicus]QDA31629.1 ABC transporter permease [Thermococcus indicus]